VSGIRPHWRATRAGTGAPPVCSDFLPASTPIQQADLAASGLPKFMHGGNEVHSWKFDAREGYYLVSHDRLFDGTEPVQPLIAQQEREFPLAQPRSSSLARPHKAWARSAGKASFERRGFIAYADSSEPLIGRHPTCVRFSQSISPSRISVRFVCSTRFGECVDHTYSL